MGRCPKVVISAGRKIKLDGRGRCIHPFDGTKGEGTKSVPRMGKSKQQPLSEWSPGCLSPWWTGVKASPAKDDGGICFEFAPGPAEYAIVCTMPEPPIVCVALR